MFEPVRFNGWPELKEAFLARYTQASFLLAPMAMALREQGVPVKIVYLGHRDGTALMVHLHKRLAGGVRRELIEPRPMAISRSGDRGS